jgi:hypothetical protein
MPVVYNKENPPVTPPRNGVSMPLEEQTFGKTSPLKGQKFWAIEPTVSNLNDVIKFAGESTVAAIVGRFFRRVGIDIFTHDKNKNADGTLDWSAILEDWASFDTGGATKSDLETQVSELQDEVQVLTDDDNYALNENDQPENPAEYIILTEKVKVLMKKITPLKKQIRAITDKYAAIAARRQANKAQTPAVA